MGKLNIAVQKMEEYLKETVRTFGFADISEGTEKIVGCSRFALKCAVFNLTVNYKEGYYVEELKTESLDDSETISVCKVLKKHKYEWEVDDNPFTGRVFVVGRVNPECPDTLEPLFVSTNENVATSYILKYKDVLDNLTWKCVPLINYNPWEWLPRMYECDPEKNTECRKTGCYLTGGECHLTAKKEYAKEDQND